MCEAFGFLDARGRVQQASCLKALRTLDAEGLIALPARQGPAPTPKPRVLASPVPEAQEVPDTAHELEALEIVLVRRKEDRAIWNALMDQEHPRGVTMFAGAQLKYLIKRASCKTPDLKGFLSGSKQIMALHRFRTGSGSC